MKVKCVLNDLTSLVDLAVKKRLEGSIHIEGPISELTVGEEYLVQAVEFGANGIWLYFHTAGDDEFPYPYPVEFFHWSDRSIPRGWTIELSTAGDSFRMRLSFPEWVNDDQFYEKLVDRVASVGAVYRAKRRRL